MSNKLLLSAIGLAFVLTFSLQPSPAQAADMQDTCREVAKTKYPDDPQKRRAWRRFCKDNLDERDTRLMPRMRRR
jgi:siroheme synthase (precorrin-2 oxidase/ferrochelatase)